MGTKEGEEVQVKGIHNTVKNVIAETFQNLKKRIFHSGTGNLKDTKQT
jgi:hypothetical protein